MELGALVCAPRGPRCEECPLARWCAARGRGVAERLPRSARAKPPVGLRWRALWIEKDGRVLLWRRDARERFLPGHWGLPEDRHLGAAARPIERLGAVRHAITHHRITLEVWRGVLVRPAPRLAKWAERRELDALLVSSLWRKAAGLSDPERRE